MSEEEIKEETETRLSQQLQPLPWYYRYSSVSKTLLHLATMLLNVAHLSNALDSARDSFNEAVTFPTWTIFHFK